MRAANVKHVITMTTAGNTSPVTQSDRFVDVRKLFYSREFIAAAAQDQSVHARRGPIITRG